jgi:hypothetical protein
MPMINRQKQLKDIMNYEMQKADVVIQGKPWHGEFQEARDNPSW